MTKYHVISTNEDKIYNTSNYIDMVYATPGTRIGIEGIIKLNTTYWYDYLDKYLTSTYSMAYYILLQQVCHVMGVGPLWIIGHLNSNISDKLRIRVQNSEGYYEWWYVGQNACDEYRGYFGNHLNYLPIENN